MLRVNVNARAVEASSMGARIRLTLLSTCREEFAVGWRGTFALRKDDRFMTVSGVLAVFSELRFL